MEKLYFYLVTISYDGSNFQGWAKQPQVFTVQGYIESVLKKIFSSSINILASSRTDKGVHAREQKFTLWLPFFLPKKRLCHILNTKLHDYVVVKKVEKVDKSFHPLRQNVSKEYRYFINTGPYDIFRKNYQWEYNLPLNISRLNEILQSFQGQHDFFNFCYCRRKDQAETNTIRTIKEIKIWKRKNLVVISINAPNFLRYQIRALIGEAINCYERKQTLETLRAKLTDTTNPFRKYKNIAPAAGLYLWKTKYNVNNAV
jgi:tRNA pseudouridine38-40 synthase